MENKDLASQRRYMRIPITVLNGVLTGTNNEANAELDRAFNKIIGVAYHEITAGGLSTNYRVGFRTDRYTWVDPVNISNWNCNTGVPVEGKFRKFKSEDPKDRGGIGYGMGDKGYVTVIPGANLSSDLTGELVLILERDNTELPRQ